MSRLLLVDDSPHAQRMGERILSDEGYEVVTVSNADSALVRLEDVDPDVVLADTVMPGRTGYDICQYIKMSPHHRHVRVILTAGVLEPFDEGQMQRAAADGTLKKPFEATALLAAVKPLAEESARLRAQTGSGTAGTAPSKHAAPAAPFVAVVDAEQVRAAVTVALDASMGTMVDEITRRVLDTLKTQAAPAALPQPVVTPAPPITKPAAAAMPAAPPPATPVPPVSTPAPEQSAPVAALPPAEPVRRVNPLRHRSGSILGLEISRPPTPGPDSDAD